VRSRISTPIDVKTKFPERKDFLGSLGKTHLPDQLDVVAEPFDPVELYDMMDCRWGVPKRSYVAPEVLR
jgi:hypothetical protein